MKDFLIPEYCNNASAAYSLLSSAQSAYHVFISNIVLCKKARDLQKLIEELVKEYAIDLY